VSRPDLLPLFHVNKAASISRTPKTRPSEHFLLFSGQDDLYEHTSSIIFTEGDISESNIKCTVLQSYPWYNGIQCFNLVPNEVSLHFAIHSLRLTLRPVPVT
jgi:hypothetical protein